MSDESFWELRLYVAGQTRRSIAAFANVRRLAEEHLKGRCRIEVIDLLKNPQLAEDDKIVALPTLVRRMPAPLRRVVGDLSDAGRTLVGLDLVALDPAASPGEPPWKS